MARPFRLQRDFQSRPGGFVVLFGSQARGDAVEGSDIDVLVVLTGDVDAGSEISRTSELRTSLSLQHDVVVSFMYMPEAEFCAEQSPLSRNVRRARESVDHVERVLRAA